MADSDPEGEAREQIAQTEEAEARDRATGMTSLFASSDTKAKAAGININLWAGLVILAGGAVFIGWVLLRPLRPSDVQEADTDRPKVE